MANKERLLTINECAERLALAPITIRTWAAARKIASVKIGRARRISERELEKLIERGTLPARDAR